MGISDDIRSKIQSAITLKYSPAEIIDKSISCAICDHGFTIKGRLAFCIPDEGYVCFDCCKSFAPEIALVLNLIDTTSSEQKRWSKPKENLTEDEWNEIHSNLDILKSVTKELSRGLSRGIIEAPYGHIGLLHYAKDIVRPQKKENETDSDYQLRLKAYRIKKICEKLKSETVDRIETLYKYFVRLGMPISENTGKNDRWNS